MSRRDLVTLVISTAAVAAFASFVVRRVYGQRTPQPFTATKIEKFLTSPGTYGRQEESVFAVRSDGSTSEIITRLAPDGRVVEQRRISDTVSRRRVSADGLTDSVTTYKIPPQIALQMGTRPATCNAGPNPQRDRLLGYEVLRVVEDIGRPGRGKRLESWRAPELNCFPLRETVTLIQPDGSQFVTNVRETTAVVVGQPQPLLFFITPHYAERSPSQVFAEFNRRYPDARHRANPTGFGARVLDDAYLQNQNQP